MPGSDTDSQLKITRSLTRELLEASGKKTVRLAYVDEQRLKGEVRVHLVYGEYVVLEVDEKRRRTYVRSGILPDGQMAHEFSTRIETARPVCVKGFNPEGS